MRIKWWIVVLIFLAMSLDKTPASSDPQYYESGESSVYTIIELVGPFPRSWEEAAQTIGSTAAECLGEISTPDQGLLSNQQLAQAFGFFPIINQLYLRTANVLPSLDPNVHETLSVGPSAAFPFADFQLS